MDQLTATALREAKKHHDNHASQAIIAAHLIQAAQAVLSNEWEAATIQMEKAQEIIDVTLDEIEPYSNLMKLDLSETTEKELPN